MIPWYLLLVVIPLASALIGWYTNVIAIKMIFRPHHPKRFGPIAFQGVLPKNHAHFARQLATVIAKDFMSAGDMVARLGIEKIYSSLKPELDPIFLAVVDDLRAELPEAQRVMFTNEMAEALRAQAEARLLSHLPQVVAEVQREADKVLDLTALLAEKVVAWGPKKLEQIIYQVSRRELKFIEYYGGIFGFLIGLIQYATINIFPIYYSLPIVGIVVGIITNYLAIQMLFYPRQPWGVGPFKIQGLFPKRQAEIAAEQAKVAAQELVFPEEIFAELIARVLPPEITAEVIEKGEEKLIERYPALKPMLDGTLPADRHAFRTKLAQRLQQAQPRLTQALAREAGKQIDVRATLTNKVEQLPKLQFEQLLRGLFEKEEFYLVVYGGLLGGVMGLVQLGLLSLGG
jgi:uncharacterized membrane protein YheB (UPF0754 family)